MKKLILGVITFTAIFGLVLFVVQAVAQANGNGGRKIVVFQTGLNDAAKDEIIASAGGAKLKNLDLIGAKAVWVPDNSAVAKLAAHSDVVRVDDDVEVFALSHKVNHEGAGGGGTKPAQVLPWGIDRIDAELVWSSGNNADSIKVGIIDTGISKEHPDLRENTKGGVNTINPQKSWDDDNGHGSHVAGIAGALNNTVGVVGAGPLIDLYAIKVLGANGSGFLSDVIEGIQWAIANNMLVINMSLGGSDVQSMHDAVIAAKNAGIVVVAAAGNNVPGGSVIFPAAYPEVIAVSATDQNNVIASWSSRGPEVDLAAPGVSIYSTYKLTGYAIGSGTSMAAPHVAGSAALVLNTPVGLYDANANGAWDPDEVQTKLRATATDLGDAGFDNLYGSGLVNAFAATQ